MQKDTSLEFNDFTSIGEENEIGEEEEEGYKRLLKSESPSLENLLSQQDLDLSYKEETENTSPPALQEDSKILKEKIERISRADSGKKQGIITRSRSTCRFNDKPPVGQVNSSEKKPFEEK